VTKLRQASEEWPYTMSWVDSMQRGRSLGRGIVMKGRWAEPHEAPSHPPGPRKRLEFPFEFPGWVLAPWSMRLFNFAYYHKHIPRHRRGILHPLTFFYPLDVVGQWNRVYGKDGFVQYQCVLPVDSDEDLCRRFFETLSQTKVGSFLTVVKDCGAEGRGMLSFPRPGISIALDLPMRGADTQTAVDALNEVVLRSGGRIYLTKDSLTRPEHFVAMEGDRLDAWNRVRRTWDPEGRLRSVQSVRLLGDKA
jgi:FAD/FMN-containing dehydrogenase